MPIYYADTTYLRIVSCISIATLLHLFLFAALSHIKQPPQKKTIRFELIASQNTRAAVANRAITASQASTSSTETETRPDIIDTEANNKTFTTPEQIKKSLPSKSKQVISDHKKMTSKRENPTQHPVTHPAFSTPSLPSIPSMPSTPSLSQVVDSDFSSFFTAQKQAKPHKHTAVSTDKHLKKMSAYEIQLLQKFLKASYYDKINSILRKEKKVNKIRLEITLFDNGVIKNAKLEIASKNNDLNRAAIQTALSASPYPPPPESDKKNGYKYHINLEFQPF
jgi:TonB family protein